MNNRELKNIIKIFESSELSRMKLEREDVKIELQKDVEGNIQTTPALKPSSSASKEAEGSPPPEPEPSYDPIKAPLVGTYYEAPAPDQPPFVQEGQRVEKGDTVCIIEAMKVMNEITAPKGGRIVNIHAQNGEMVQYDQTIMEIE